MSKADFHNWLIQVIDSEHPDESIVAYYFGIFEGEKHYTLYLIGSSSYDLEDTDWANNNDFEPVNKYFVLPNDFDHYSWNEIIEEVKKYLTDFVASALYLNSFFSKAKMIATGFDEGDLVEILG